MLRVLLAVVAAALVLTVATRRSAASDDPLSDDQVLHSCGKAKGKFTVSFRPEVDVQQLVTWAMGFSCKKFLYSAALATRTSKVILVTPGTLTASEAWSLFRAALASMNLTVVPKGKVLEIVESNKARDEALAIVKTFPDGGADVIRLLLRPEHVAVEDLRAALDLVKSQWGVVSALPSLHAILVTDDAGHIARMKTLVTELDRPTGGDGVFAIPLDHIDATALVATIQQLVGAAGGTLRLVADDRTNALLMTGTAAEFTRVKALAATLDVDADDAARIHRFELRHAQAREVAANLGALTGGDASLAAVRIAADEAGNALLVLASTRDAVALRALVAEMDAPRQQVYIEALVLELESSQTRELGAAWHHGQPRADGSTWVGALRDDSFQSIVPKDALASAGAGLLGGIVGKELELLGQTIPSFAMLLRARAYSSRLDVLASPHILTIDNHPATISVGANIPYKGSNATAAGAFGQVPPSIERQKIALSLAITPHVSAVDLDDPGLGQVVRLDIKLDSQLLGQADFGGLGPTWKERSIETSVILRDEESVVLGGLVDERVEDRVTGVPWLSSIPLVGALFRTTEKVRLKSNLLVILTPHILDDSTASRAVLERRMRERDEFARAADDLRRRVLEPNLDYRKKRGLLAEIDQAVIEIERERAALEALRAKPRVRAGRIDGESP
jgi:general secretion pathway protein D